MKVIFAVVLFPLLFAGAVAYAQSPCEECLKVSQEELKRCLDNAISQEDKKSCAEKRQAHAKVCESGECKIERAQGEKQGEVSAEGKQNSGK